MRGRAPITAIDVYAFVSCAGAIAACSETFTAATHEPDAGSVEPGGTGGSPPRGPKDAATKPPRDGSAPGRDAHVPNSSSGGASAEASMVGGSGGTVPGRDASADAPARPTYRDVVLADHPLVYWRMGIKSGLTVPDETGGHNDLVLQGTGHAFGTAGALSGDSDTAIGFDGVQNYAMASDPRALDFPDGVPFTEECWAQRVASGGEYFQHIVGNQEGSAPQRNGYILYIVPAPASGQIATTSFEYDALGGDTGIFGPLIAASTWSHLAGVFDGSKASLYVDGTLAGSKDVAASITARSSLFAVARSPGETRRFFAGAIDEIAVYPTALTVTQIVKHISAARQP